jgi:hypothetical protein
MKQHYPSSGLDIETFIDEEMNDKGYVEWSAT